MTRVTRHCLVLALTCPLWIGQAQAAADEYSNDTFQPGVSASIIYDDNIFRLANGQVASGATGPYERSDVEVTTAVGLKIDKSYSLQRFVLNGSLVDYDHTDHTFLNFLAKNLDATWFWAITPDVTGHFIYSRAQTLNSFTDFSGLYARNIDTNTVRRVDADWRVRGEIHLGLAIEEFVQRNDQPTYALEDVRIDSLEPNISYQSMAGNSVTLYGRSANGNYLDAVLSAPQQTDTQFVEHEQGMRVSYQIDSKSSMYAQIGELSRTHEHFGSRNFNGIVAQFKYNLQFTGKTAFSALATRALGSYQSDTSSYLATNTVSAGPTWSATSKTTFGARLLDIQYHFGGTLIPTSLRSDNIIAETLTANWSALRNLELNATFTHSSRTSNDAGLGFADNTVSLFCRFTFQ